MSFLDKLVASVTPPESEQDRIEARRKAESLAGQSDWLAVALEHHRKIESCFELAARAATAQERTAACRELATVLTGHANAEESVLYPAMTEHGEKAHATMAYEEQAMTKVQLARLEKIDPNSQEWQDKLEHIRGAVLHHIYEEEGTWFPQLRESIPAQDDAMLTSRFVEEFERYAGGSGARGRQSGQPVPLQMAAQMEDQPQQDRSPPQNWGAADY